MATKTHSPLLGDADVSRVASVLGEPTRARVLMALADGRALPASVLAAESGVSAQAMSGHLARLLDAGLVAVEPTGRYRYYRLASPAVGEALEALARISPPQPVRSLRQGTRARALRNARTCYDHLAGRIGVEITAVLLERGALAREDGWTSTARRAEDTPSTRLASHPYRLGDAADEVLGELGVDLRTVRGGGGKRPLLRFCVDWSEQRHHLAGLLGAVLATTLLDAGWLARFPRGRALRVTDEGAKRLTAFGCPTPGDD